MSRIVQSIIPLLANLATATAVAETNGAGRMGIDIPEPRIWHVPVEEINVDFRGGPVVLASVTFTADVPGDVLVQFDGMSLLSPGDRLVLAASNTPNWSVDDGNVSTEVFSSDINRKPFSHTRSYRAVVGENTFYAVGENWVEQDGTGRGSVYGSLTAKFYPDSADPGAAFARNEGIREIGVNLRGADVELARIDINVAVTGSVLVRFDGQAVTSVGDRILLAANDSPFWEVNQGHVSVESPNPDLNITPFAHSRMFSIGPGNHSFFAAAENWVEQDGTGIASVYGNLTLEFVPDDHPSMRMVQVPIVQPSQTIDKGDIVLAQVDLPTGNPAKVLARIDGLALGSPGDRVLMAANNLPIWQVNSGHVSFEPIDSDYNTSPFSHTRLFSQTTGRQPYYAVAENWVETGGNGQASFYGHLTLQVFTNDRLFRDRFESP